MVTFPKRGEIYWTRFDPVIGSEQGGTRPAVVVQNDIGNRHARTTIVVPLTSNSRLSRFPFAVAMPEGVTPKPSIANCGQLRNVDKLRLSGEPIASLDAQTMRAVDDALRASLGLY